MFNGKVESKSKRNGRAAGKKHQLWQNISAKKLPIAHSLIVR